MFSHNHDAGFAEKVLVREALFESEFQQCCKQVLMPEMWGCAQSIEAIEQFQLERLLLSIPKTSWQVNPNRIMERCLHKCIHKVNLAGCPTKAKEEDREESHCASCKLPMQKSQTHPLSHSYAPFTF